MIDNIKIEYIPISQPIQAEYNPRKISEKAFEKLKDSIKRFGLVDPLLINKNPERENILIGGHQRLKAAKALELDEVPAVFLDLTLDKERELNVRLNQNTGEFDESLLIEFFNANELEEWGFEDVSFFENEEEEGGDEGDYDDTPPVEPVSVLGDLYELHSLESGIIHRVQCGDSCDADVVAKTMDGGEIDLFLSDPPYGVSYVGKTKDALEIKNDNLSEEETEELWKDCLSACWAFWRGGASIYATVPPGPLNLVFASALHELGVLRQQMVWNKDSMVLGRSDYHYKHEPILYGWKPGASHYFVNDRTKTTVLDFSRPKRNAEHPTMKPVSLWCELISNSTRSNQNVYDPFLGSGTTLIACEKLNRICYGQELDPKYMDVIVRRWISYMKENNRRFAVHRNGVMLTEDQIGELS